MPAVTAMTNCPSEETLAAFLDGRLDPQARRQVVEHLAECGDCRDLVLAAEEMAQPAEDPKVVEFRPRGRYVWTGLIGTAAAAILILLLPPVKDQIAFAYTGGMSAVKNGYDSLTVRPIESRIIGFDYKELKTVPRSGGDPEDSDDLEKIGLNVASGRIGESEGLTSRRRLHAKAVVELMLGHRDEATKLMERVAALRPEDPELRADLAAVYVERARFGSATDVAEALRATERACTLSDTAETAWNRAVALKLAGRDEESKRAWEHYLKLDPSSPWSAEARRNLQRLAGS